MVWCFRGWRKSFPEWFGISTLGESYFPNGLELVVVKIWKLTVQRNGHVRLLGHYYSVPHTYVGKKVFGLMVEDFCGVFPGWKFDD